MWSLAVSCLLVLGAKAFAPAPIRWGSFAIAPRDSVSNGFMLPQELTLKERSSFPNGIPHFVNNLDRTISWEAPDAIGKVCIEASGERSGDTVHMNHCTGGRAQLWNVLPYGHGSKHQIRLKDTSKCVSVKDKEGGLNGVPLELRECEDSLMESWEFEETMTLPIQGPSQRHVFSVSMPSLKHATVRCIPVAVLLALSLSGWLWRRRKQALAVVLRRGEIPSSSDLGGVALTIPLTAHLNLGRQNLLPAAMVLAPMPEDHVVSSRDANRREQLSESLIRVRPQPEHPSSSAVIGNEDADSNDLEQFWQEPLEAEVCTFGHARLNIHRDHEHLAETASVHAMLKSAEVFGRLLPAVFVLEVFPPEISEGTEDTLTKPLSPAVISLNKWVIKTIKGALIEFYRDRDSEIPRFYVLETVARVPYFAYVSCLHLFESMGLRGNTERLRLHYAEADNELHHLLIMEELGGDDAFIDRFIAQHLAFGYYWYNIVWYLFYPRAAYHLGQLIEESAFSTYSDFLETNADELRKLPVPAVAHKYYSGRDSFEGFFRGCEQLPCNKSPTKLENLYDVFVAIRNDEGEHMRTLSDLVEVKDWCNSLDACPAILDIDGPRYSRK